MLTTGHSLGAAMSGVAAFDLKLTYGDKLNVSMINFGMPRVGNPAFAKHFASLKIKSWRAVHYHDIVPHVPPQDLPLIGDFHHVGTEVWWFKEKGDAARDWRQCDGSGEDPHCSDSVPIYEWNPKDHDVYLGIANNNCGVRRK